PALARRPAHRGDRGVGGGAAGARHRSGWGALSGRRRRLGGAGRTGGAREGAAGGPGGGVGAGGGGPAAVRADVPPGRGHPPTAGRLPRSAATVATPLTGGGHSPRPAPIPAGLPAPTPPSGHRRHG